MFERTTLSLVALAAASAAAGLIVFALGFALYALVEPSLGAAGAAALVAAVAGLGLGAYALILALRSAQRAREAELARAELSRALPPHLAAIAAERPLVSLAITIGVGFMAARYPGLSRDLLSLLNALRGEQR